MARRTTATATWTAVSAGHAPHGDADAQARLRSSGAEQQRPWCFPTDGGVREVRKRGEHGLGMGGGGGGDARERGRERRWGKIGRASCRERVSFVV